MSPKIAYRFMLKTDILDILSIEEESNPVPWTKQNFMDCIEKEYYCLVQEFNGVMSGFSITSFSIDEAHLLNIGITPQFRRKGLGSNLLEKTELAAKAVGCKDVFLEVRKSNIKGIKLYKKNKYKQVGLRKNYYRPSLDYPREDALLFSKKVRKIWMLT